ncbi:MAG: hypothetical protein GX142_08690 [Chloroflexi bacterium]|nr:hypothetical protein [Chloroflexota bacterium]
MKFLSNGITTSTALVLLLFVMWIIQLVLTYFQMKRFYKRVNTLRKSGITSIGMAGSFLKGRIYTVIVIGEDDVIVNAEKLSGMTVFSTLKPVTELVGQNINDILDETKAFSITKKERESFIVAIQGMKK